MIFFFSVKTSLSCNRVICTFHLPSCNDFQERKYLFRPLNLTNKSLSDVHYRRSWSRSVTPCEHIDTSTAAAGRRAPRTSDATDLPESARAHQTRCKIRTEARARESIWIFFGCRHGNGYLPPWTSHTMFAILFSARLNVNKRFDTKQRIFIAHNLSM